MNLLVTGANGFIGRHVVDAARHRHQVRAQVRPAADVSPLTDTPGVDVVRTDLRDGAALPDMLGGIDVVVHLAAAKGGGLHDQLAATVVGTENLLQAMENTGVEQLVGVSSFSVYDVAGLAAGSVIDEDAPLVADTSARDDYTQAKLIQEQLFWRFAERGGRVVIARPGMVYGPGNLWHPLLGFNIGARFVRVGGRATLPLTFVENCAEALVAAAEAVPPPGVAVQVVNIVDDDLPTQQEYVDILRRHTGDPTVCTVPWPVLRGTAALAATIDRCLLGQRARLPGVLVPQQAQARFRPMRYTNDRAKAALGWQPRHALADAIARSLGEHGVEVRA